MTLPGWFFLAVSWGFILGLGVFCFMRVLKRNIKK